MLVGVKVDVDRIIRDQRREEARAGHKVARSDDGPRHMTVDRRAYFGELPIEARLAQRCIEGSECPLCGSLGCHETLIVLARDGVRADEAFGAGAVCFGELEIGDAATALSNQAVDLGLKRSRVDLEEELAFLDARAIFKGNAVDIAADARANLDRIHGLKASGEFLPFAQRLVNHLSNRNFGQGCAGGDAAALLSYARYRQTRRMRRARRNLLRAVHGFCELRES